ncbi:MAG: hypothetical protein AB1630_02370 [bacterium]
MQTLTLETTIKEDGKLQIDIPCSLSKGPAEVVIVVQPLSTKPIHSLRGIWKGKVNSGFDIQGALKGIRKEWEKEWEGNND